MHLELLPGLAAKSFADGAGIRLGMWVSSLAMPRARPFLRECIVAVHAQEFPVLCVKVLAPCLLEPKHLAALRARMHGTRITVYPVLVLVFCVLLAKGTIAVSAHVRHMVSVNELMSHKGRFLSKCQIANLAAKRPLSRVCAYVVPKDELRCEVVKATKNSSRCPFLTCCTATSERCRGSSCASGGSTSRYTVVCISDTGTLWCEQFAGAFGAFCML
mmetsp:Transcript_6929/g.12913  ORF Transcript_6929/g.12913 Transcript_6929/m.12913 type:complete len:217 (-) Transcript_6929:111-761(-)